MTIIKYMTFLIPYSCTCIVSRRGGVNGRGAWGGPSSVNRGLAGTPPCNIRYINKTSPAY